MVLAWASVAEALTDTGLTFAGLSCPFARSASFAGSADGSAHVSVDVSANRLPAEVGGPGGCYRERGRVSASS